MTTEWIMVSDQLPANMVHVLVEYGRDGVVFGQTVAVYVREQSVDCDAYEYDEHELFADYDEVTDAYYWPAGWYERQSANPEYLYCAMTEDVIAWMHLPLTLCARTYAAKWHALADDMPEENQHVIFVLLDGRVVASTLSAILQRVHISKIAMWTEMPKLRE